MNALLGLVGVAASTGGPGALRSFCSVLPGDLPIAVLVAQHMPQPFTAQLARHLNTLTTCSVCESQEGTALVAGQIVIGRGGHDLTVVRQGNRWFVSEQLPRSIASPSADVLFTSLAASAHGPDAPRLAAVVLTGMGVDGAAGAAAIKAQGGFVAAQDADSSLIDSMPKAVRNRGLADVVGPPVSLAQAIVRWAQQLVKGADNGG